MANLAGETGLVLRATPHEIAVQVAHERIRLGQVIEDLEHGRIAEMLRKAIFAAVKETILDSAYQQRTNDEK